MPFWSAYSGCEPFKNPGFAAGPLERQKTASPAEAIGNQTVNSQLEVQGRPAVCQFFYRLDPDSEATADPQLWKVTVQWEHSGKIKEIQLVGSVPRS